MENKTCYRYGPDVVRDFLASENPISSTQFACTEGTILEKLDAQVDFIVLVRSLKYAVRVREDNTYEINVLFLDKNLFNQLHTKEKEDPQDSKWYHQVTNHKVRTAAIGGVAVVAFIVGKCLGK